MNSRWIVLTVKGARVASYPFSDHNEKLTRKLFRGVLIQETPIASYFDVRRAPTDAECAGMELDPPNS